MHKKIVRLLSASVVTMGAFLWGCSESDLGSGASDFKGGTAVIKNDSKQMWAKINESGSIATYFDSLSQKGKAPVVNSSSHYNNQCAAPALQMDENTRYLDELESLFDEGELVEGVCGKALKLDDGQVAPLGVNLIDSMSVGTVEFWFRPNEDFYDKKARTLIGNDGARIHFFYKNGEIYFQKNHHNQHFYVKGAVELKDDWNLIAGQWGDGYMSVWVNGELVDRWEHTKGYVPAQRGIPFENLVVIGYKSSCCMEGPGQYEAMTTSGSFDQFRISNIARYAMPDSVLTCKTSALVMDDKTLYLDELDAEYSQGTLVDGVCGKAISLKDDESIQTGINLIDKMAAGTVEFWFRPGEDFNDVSARTLLGNDGARVHFFVKDGKLVFQKNHADIHYYVQAPVQLKNDWNLIAGQWGDGFMSIWVNGKMIASKKHEEGYMPAQRGIDGENLIVIGRKSRCCMEGPGQYSAMTTSGAFDQLRISSVPRYTVKEDTDTLVVRDTLNSEKPVVVIDTVVVEKPVVATDTVVIEKPVFVIDTVGSRITMEDLGPVVDIDSVYPKCCGPFIIKMDSLEVVPADSL